MDFSTPQKPQAIYDYLAAEVPDLKQPDSCFTRVASSYLLGIGTYYEQQAAALHHPGEESSPRCTLENVLATVLHPDLKQVLGMLSADLRSAQVATPFIEAYHQEDKRQIAGIVAFTQMLLSGLTAGALASERVGKHLHQFPSSY